MNTETTDGAAHELRGAAKVRSLYIDPLKASGVVCRPDQTQSGFEKELALLDRWLATLSPQSLRGLVDLTLRRAKLDPVAQKVLWPPASVIRKWSFGFQVQKPRDDYPTSVMACVMGRDAFEQGYHVELMWLAMQLGPPPQRYDIERLKSDAVSNRARRERIGRGSFRGDDKQWLKWFEELERDCLEILAEARKKRGEGDDGTGAETSGDDRPGAVERTV